MHALVEMVPLTRAAYNASDPQNWVQPIESVVDVSEFNDMALMLTITEVNHDSGNIDFFLATAMENRDERYTRIRRLARFSADLGTTEQHYFYFTGAGEAASTSVPTADETPGFGRFCRIEVDGISTASNHAVFDVKALFRSR